VAGFCSHGNALASSMEFLAYLGDCQLSRKTPLCAASVSSPC
jgi:hypothetical protein